jgi:hypothetical protein
MATANPNNRRALPLRRGLLAVMIRATGIGSDQNVSDQ